MTLRPSYDSSLADPEKYGTSSPVDEKRHSQCMPVEEYVTDEHITALPASIPYADIPHASPAQQPYRPTRRPWWARLKTEYILLSKTKKVAIIFGVGALIVLIIGLAAGLSARSSSSAQNLPLPNNHGGPYTGDLTYYDPGLGACGITSNSQENIVAVSHIIFDAVSTGSNPNANPLCGKKIRARREGKSVDLTVVDRCTGCKPSDLDVTESVFRRLANIDQGRVLVEWSWLEEVPGADLPSATPSATTPSSTLVPSNSTSTVISTAISATQTSIVATSAATTSTTIETPVPTTEAPVVAPTTTPEPPAATTTEAPPAPPATTTDAPVSPPPNTSTVVDTASVPTTTDVAPAPVTTSV